MELVNVAEKNLQTSSRQEAVRHWLHGHAAVWKARGGKGIKGLLCCTALTIDDLGT